MSTYVMADIHGCYREFMKLLEMINLQKDDHLFIIGDIIDRGEDPVKCLTYIMDHPNISLMIGNHEVMMIITIRTCSEDLDRYGWMSNGGGNTLSGLLKHLPNDEDIIPFIDYFKNSHITKNITVGDQDYTLVHAGIRIPKRSRKKDIDMSVKEIILSQNFHDMIWIREEFYTKKAIPNHKIIFGHTPIQAIDKKSNGSRVWYDNKYHDKICIDGGCVYGGYLLALRLDDMEEFSIKKYSGNIYH